MLEFLPQTIKDGLSHLNLNDVYEIRLRANQPIRVNYRGKYRYLGAYGICKTKDKALYCDADEIADCVFRAGKCSVYAVEEQIKRGFITAESGERIGLAGEYVLDKGVPLTIRDFTSLCIRVPHEILGAGNAIYQRCMSDKLRSILICSPPGLGKTTILRDLSRQICQNDSVNLLICDERGEIASGEVGETADILRYCDKSTAFEAGIRAMRPELIITDELSAGDCQAIERAVSAGISVVASAHYAKFEYIAPCFLGVFERFVILNNNNIGEIDGIYDKNGVKIEECGK